MVILFFYVNLKCFLLCNVHQIGLFPSLAIGLFHPTYGQPLDPMGIHLFCYAHGKEKIHHMMSCKMPFHPSQKMQVFMLHINRPTFFYHLPSSPHVNRSTLCFWLMAFACWLMLSLLTPLEWLDFTCYIISWGGYNNGHLNKGKTLLILVPYILVFPSCHLSFWVLTSTSRQFFPSLC